MEWLSANKKKAIVAAAILISLIVVVPIAIGGYGVVTAWYNDKFVFPGSTEPVDYSKDKNVLQCLQRRVPARVIDLCTEAFRK